MLIYGTKLVASIANLWDIEPQTTSDNFHPSNHVQSCLIYIPIRKHPNRPMQRSNLQRCFFVRQCLFPFYCLRLWFHYCYIRSLAETPHLSSRSHYSCWLEVLPFFFESKSRHLGRTYWNRTHLYIYISVGNLRTFFPRRTPVQRVCLLAWWRETLGWNEGGQDFGGFLG